MLKNNAHNIIFENKNDTRKLKIEDSNFELHDLEKMKKDINKQNSLNHFNGNVSFKITKKCFEFSVLILVECYAMDKDDTTNPGIDINNCSELQNESGQNTENCSKDIDKQLPSGN